MREIKFRAWNKIHNIMMKWENLRNQYNTLNCLTYEHLEVMQYTGLKDKNDKEIYEGDIVNYTDGEFTRRRGQIEFDCFGFMLSEIITNNREYPQIGLLGEIEDFEEFGFEIIGNIYENPELLKE